MKHDGKRLVLTFLTPIQISLTLEHVLEVLVVEGEGDVGVGLGVAAAAGPGPSGLLARGYKPEDLERLRRSSDPGSTGGPGAANNEADAGIPSPDDQRPKFPADFRNARDMDMISNSSPQERNDGKGKGKAFF